MFLLAASDAGVHESITYKNARAIFGQLTRIWINQKEKELNYFLEIETYPQVLQDVMFSKDKCSLLNR